VLREWRKSGDMEIPILIDKFYLYSLSFVDDHVVFAKMNLHGIGYGIYTETIERTLSKLGTDNQYVQNEIQDSKRNLDLNIQ
jgi:hypothetical protein